MSAWLAPILGFVGALVGGGCSLLGTWMAHRFQAEREQKRQSADDAAKRLRELKEAYTEWFCSAQRMLTGLTVTDVLSRQQADPGATRAALSAAVAESSATGYRVRLLEPDAEARKRTVEVVTALGTMMERLGASRTGPSETGQLVGEVMSKLAEVEKWLVEVRFADTVVR